MDKDELKSILDRKGMDWLIAAMVDGSIEYHTPGGAKAADRERAAGRDKGLLRTVFSHLQGRPSENDRR